MCELCGFSVPYPEQNHRTRGATVVAGTLGGYPEIIDVDEVIPAEHRRGAMPAERHDRVRVDTGADQMTDAAPPEIMHDPAVEADLLTRAAPELAEVAHGPSLPVEDVRAIEAARFETPLHHRSDLPFDGEDAGVLVLAVLGPQPKGPLGPVVVAPLERPDLADPPRREEEETDQVGQMGRQMRAKGLDLLARKEALPHAGRVGFEFR